MKIIYSILLVLLLFSCKQKDDSAQPNADAAKFITQLNLTDTFRYEIPKIRGNPDTSFLRSLQNELKLLGFESIEKGYDSIELRIGFGLNPKNYLLIIKNQNKKWKGEMCTYKYNYDSLITIIEKKCVIKDPRSGWKKFIDQLFNLQILSLPDYHDIPGYSQYMPTDAEGVTVEVATKKVYRFYHLFEPMYMKDKFWQSRKMDSILHLIDEQFSLDLFQH
jgi:hypothetical protein